jgi:hypothetical protein
LSRSFTLELLQNSWFWSDVITHIIHKGGKNAKVYELRKKGESLA